MIPGLGRSPEGGHGNSLWYSSLENLHGKRSLAGYSPWGHKKLEPRATKHSTAHGVLSHDVTAGMDFENIMLSERSQFTKLHILYDFTYMKYSE